MGTDFRYRPIPLTDNGEIRPLPLLPIKGVENFLKKTKKTKKTKKK